MTQKVVGVLREEEQNQSSCLGALLERRKFYLRCLIGDFAFPSSSAFGRATPHGGFSHRKIFCAIRRKKKSRVDEK